MKFQELRDYLREEGFLGWVAALLKAPEGRRKQWVEEVLAGFREYRPKNSKKTQQFLSDVLAEGKEFELVGFVPKVQYIKAEGPDDELGVIWEHPHMNPQLLYKHTKLPLFIITGPGLRWNESLLNEVGLRNEQVRGITG